MQSIIPPLPIATAEQKCCVLWQVNEGLSDTPAGLLDFSMKQELEQVTHHVHETKPAVICAYDLDTGQIAPLLTSQHQCIP